MIIDSLKTNRINAPDGDYLILTKMLNYNTDKGSWEDWQSKTKVEVRGGLLETSTLLKATEEVMNDCGYWGKFLEGIEYNPQSKTLNIIMGS